MNNNKLHLRKVCKLIKCKRKKKIRRECCEIPWRGIYSIDEVGALR